MKLLKELLFVILISTFAFSCSENDSEAIDKEEESIDKEEEEETEDEEEETEDEEEETEDGELVEYSTTAPYFPIDFEPGGFGASWTWTVFENDDDPALEFVENPDKTGINSSATVAKITARRNGAPYAGCETKHGTDIGGFTFDENNKTVKIMVYKSVKSDVGIKFAEFNGEAQPEIKVANTKINEWEELTFDLSGSIGKGASKVVDQIIVFPDFRNRNSESIVYFDNITFGNDDETKEEEEETEDEEEETEDEELVGDSNVPPYYPIDFEADGFGASWTWTVFENDDDPAVEFVENPDKTGINSSATVAKITARRNGAPYAGCETKHGTDIGGFTFDENNKTVKIMVYKSVKSDVGIKFAEFNGEAQLEIKVANTKINEWEELTFDLSGSIGKGITKVVDQIIVFPDFRNRNSESIVYFDNITFGN